METTARKHVLWLWIIHFYLIVVTFCLVAQLTYPIPGIKNVTQNISTTHLFNLNCNLTRCWDAYWLHLILSNHHRRLIMVCRLRARRSRNGLQADLHETKTRPRAVVLKEKLNASCRARIDGGERHQDSSKNEKRRRTAMAFRIWERATTWIADGGWARDGAPIVEGINRRESHTRVENVHQVDWNTDGNCMDSFLWLKEGNTLRIRFCAFPEY